MSGSHSDISLAFPYLEGGAEACVAVLLDTLDRRNRLAAHDADPQTVVIDPKSRDLLRVFLPPQPDGAATTADAADGTLHCAIRTARIRIGAEYFLIKLISCDIARHGALIEVQFPSDVYETIYCFDEEQAVIDETAKADFVRLCTDLASVLKAPVFTVDYSFSGLRLVGPPRTDQIVAAMKAFPEEAGPQGVLVGIAADRFDGAAFDRKSGPLREYYTRFGYFLSDYLWPSILTEAE